jgi:hypothetical protein
MSPAYLEALRRHQSDILDSITEDITETQMRAERYQAWVADTAKRHPVTADISIDSIGNESINEFENE